MDSESRVDFPGSLTPLWRRRSTPRPPPLARSKPRPQPCQSPGGPPRADCPAEARGAPPAPPAPAPPGARRLRGQPRAGQPPAPAAAAAARAGARREDAAPGPRSRLPEAARARAPPAHRQLALQPPAPAPAPGPGARPAPPGGPRRAPEPVPRAQGAPAAAAGPGRRAPGGPLRGAEHQQPRRAQGGQAAAHSQEPGLRGPSQQGPPAERGAPQETPQGAQHGGGAAGAGRAGRGRARARRRQPGLPAQGPALHVLPPRRGQRPGLGQPHHVQEEEQDVPARAQSGDGRQGEVFQPGKDKENAVLYQNYKEKALDIDSDEESEPKEQKSDEKIVIHHKPLRSTWSQLSAVKRNGLSQTVSQEERKRQEAIFEVISSEHSYLLSLEILIRMFKNSKELGDTMTKTESHHLFSNITDVCEASKKFFTELEARHQNNIFIDDISDIVEKHTASTFDPYVKYCTNEVYQQRTLQKLLATNPSFKEVLSRIESHEDCRNLPMISFLILPMQRVTRLPLLMDTICQKTPKDSPKYEVCKRALKEVSKLVRLCNEGARKMERTEMMYTINSQLEFKIKPFPLVSSSRWLVKRGELTAYVEDTVLFSRRTSKQQVYFFLFNDVLIITKKKSEESYNVNDYSLRDQLLVESCDSEELNSSPGKNSSTMLYSRQSSASHLFTLTVLSNHASEKVEMLLGAETHADPGGSRSVVHRQAARRAVPAGGRRGSHLPAGRRRLVRRRTAAGRGEGLVPHGMRQGDYLPGDHRQERGEDGAPAGAGDQRVGQRRLPRPQPACSSSENSCRRGAAWLSVCTASHFHTGLAGCMGAGCGGSAAAGYSARVLDAGPWLAPSPRGQERHCPPLRAPS
uniref:Rho guanine nucleotide exchange factor 26 n=1 Tax=Canis lupus familiaris TaxID=9615 RepID=A0A8P0PIT6_CANLF